MSRFTLSQRRSLRAAALGLAALVAPAALRAQSTTPKVFYACYVPNSGTVYRIKEADLKQQCAKSTHVQFSWTDGASTPSTVITVTAADVVLQPGTGGAAVAICPDGYVPSGGGHAFKELDISAAPPVLRNSAPTGGGHGWNVTVDNFAANAGVTRFTAFVRCTQ